MAKKEKASKAEIIDKVIKTVETAIVPAILTVGAIWNFDIAVYVAAGSAIVVSILTFVKLFVK